MVYTTYFARIKDLPDNVIPIAICSGHLPEGLQHLRWYKKLGPKWSFFKIWKQTHDNDYYTKHFNQEVLGVLNPDEVVKELNKFIRNYPIDTSIALVCYEKPEDFCHRHLVADWLTKAGYPVKEYEFN